MFEINSLKLLLEEERSITADYTNQANAQLKTLELQNTNLKYPFFKIGLSKEFTIVSGLGRCTFILSTIYCSVLTAA